MPVAASYTEATLADFLVLALGDYASILGWDDSHAQITAAVSDTERLLDVSDVADATDPVAVEALGTVAVLRRAVVSLGARYDTSEDQQSRHASQLHQAARAALALAEQAAMPHLTSLHVQISRVEWLHDPYAVRAEDAVL